MGVERRLDRRRSHLAWRRCTNSGTYDSCVVFAFVVVTYQRWYLDRSNKVNPSSRNQRQLDSVRLAEIKMTSAIFRHSWCDPAANKGNCPHHNKDCSTHYLPFACCALYLAMAWTILRRGPNSVIPAFLSSSLFIFKNLSKVTPFFSSGSAYLLSSSTRRKAASEVALDTD